MQNAMNAQPLKIAGQDMIVLPRAEFDKLIKRAGVLPTLPAADGSVPGGPFVDASMARTVIQRRIALGWTQQELADRAGVRMETIGRLEAGKHLPRLETIERIDAALNQTASPSGRKTKSARSRAIARR